MLSSYLNIINTPTHASTFTSWDSKKQLEFIQQNNVRIKNNFNYTKSFLPQELTIFKKEIQDWKKLSEEKRRYDFVYPETDHNFLNINEDDFKRIAGRKWRVVLKKALYFVDYFQYLVPKNRQVVIPVPTTNKMLLSFFKEQSELSRFIHKAEEFQLLYCYDSKYLPSKLTKLGGYCRKYILNRSMMSLIKEWSKKYNISLDDIKKLNENQYIFEDISNVSQSDYDKIKFGSNLRISKHLTNAQVESILYKKFKMLRTYQNKADYLNKYLDTKNQIVFDINIRRSKNYITKIGIRATNSVVSLKSTEEVGSNYKGIYRKDYLKEFFDNKKYYSYDVKSSIYRVQYLLNNGKWLNRKVDLYEIINGGEFDTRQDRNNFKYLCMYLFFEKSSNTLFNHIKQRIPVSINTIGEEAVKKDIEKRLWSLNQAIGDTCKSEVFLHESCIYLDVAIELFKRKIKFVQIYDAFYTESYVSDLEEITAKCAEEYYDRYIKGKKNVKN